MPIRFFLPHLWSKYIRASSCLTLLAMTCLLVFPFPVSAHTRQAQNSGPSFQVNAGFDGRYRDGNWIPIQVKLSNNGADFSGTLSVDIPSAYGNTIASTYTIPVTLATGAQKQLVFSIPLSLGALGTTQSVTVHLLDNTGHLVGTQIASLRSLGPNDLFVGLLSDQSSGFGPLSTATFPGQAQSASLLTEQLNAANMPTEAALLRNFNLIILDNFTTSTLSNDQITALQEWVYQGGTLLTVGGPEWHTTLSPLPASLLPVTITGTQTLPSGTTLLPIGGPGNSMTQPGVKPTAPASLLVSVGQPTPTSNVILASGTTPLLVQAHQAQGHLYYLAFDPTLDPIINWSQASQLWQSLLFRTIGDQVVVQNPNIGQSSPAISTNLSDRINGSMVSLLQTFLPNTLPSVTLILAILLGYILVLGPIRFLIVRRFKRRDWNWRIILSTIVIFSLLSYGIALVQKGTSVIGDTVSVVQLGTSDGNTTPAYSTTYVGVFVPSAGNSNIHLSANSLVQSDNGTYQFGPQASEPLTTITQTSNGTDVILQSSSTWTLNTVTAEQASILSGSLTSHLTFANGTLSGTVSNNFAYGLSDTYVLMGSSYIAIGHIAAHETKNIALSLNTPGNTTPIADQIATNTGFSSQANVGSYQTPHSELERHIDMLSALSGEGSYCAGNGGPCYSVPYKVMTTNGGVVVSNNGILLTNSTLDPLLLPNAPATLIGWADTPISAITINGGQPSGVQETLFQAPLSVQYTGTVSLPTSFIQGQVINVQSQGTNIQEATHGVYTMTTGSIVFELLAPPNIHINSATINETQNITGIVQQSTQGTGTLNDVTHLQASLYNWHSNTWDSVTINTNSFSFPVSDTASYVGPSGRILVRFANQDATQGTIAFDTPTLQIQGNAQ